MHRLKIKLYLYQGLRKLRFLLNIFKFNIYDDWDFKILDICYFRAVVFNDYNIIPPILKWIKKKYKKSLNLINLMVIIKY